MRFGFLIFILSLPIFFSAQNAIIPPPDTTKQLTKAIPLAEIPSEAERLFQKINKEYQTEIYKSTIHDVRLFSDSLKSTSSALATLSNLVLDQDIPYFVLETAINRWNRFIPVVAKDISKLKTYSSHLSEVNDELNELNKIWLLTKSLGTEEEYPEVITSRLDEVLGMIDSVKTVLNDSLSKCLGLQNDLVDIQIKAETYLKDLTDFKTKTLSELLTSRSSPIWALRQETEIDSSALDFDLSLLLSYSEEDVTNYYNTEEKSIFTILFIFVIFWVALIWMKSRYNELKAKEVKELELGKYIFSRAIPSALLFTLILQSLILSKKPYILELGFTFIIFVLFLIIIPGLVVKRLRWNLVVLSFVFLLVNFDLLIFHKAQSIQLISLFESTLVFLFLGWFLLRESKIKPLEHEKKVWFNFLSFIGPIYFIFIIVAIIANMLGYVYLARLINTGIVNSALIWMLLVAAFRIIEGLTYLFLETNFALRSRIVLSRRKDILGWTTFIFHKILFALWVYYTLQILMVWDPVSEWALTIWNLGFKSETIDISVGKISSFFIILVFVWALANFIKLLLQVEILSRFKLSRGVPMAIASLTNYTLIVIGFFVALIFAGFDLTKISFIIGTLGVGIGFGLQNIVSNFISGLILIFERPIAIGDIIIVDTVEGTVTSIGIRSSKILQYNGDEEIIPNATLISGRVTNRTMTNSQRRFLIPINTALDTDPDFVIELLQNASKEVKGVLSYPEPRVYFDGIYEQSLRFSFYYWIGENIMDVKSETNLKVHQYLREAGIKIPIPRQIEYHMDKPDDIDLLSKQEVKKGEKDANDKKS